jgi:hypothetical protein
MRLLGGEFMAPSKQRRNVPDTCEAEGGDAVLNDAYTVKGEEVYFLFTCAWAVQHSGIGLNGIQYKTFVYVADGESPVINRIKLSQYLSGYEGSGGRGGSSSYAWYTQRRVASEKLLELEAGRGVDSLGLAHNIVMSRLEDGDYQAITYYLSPERVEQLLVSYPVNESTIGRDTSMGQPGHADHIYYDFGRALDEAGEKRAAYNILKGIEKKSTDRTFLTLAIADALWELNKMKSRKYYQKYIRIMKKAGEEKMLPARVFERAAVDR